MAENLVNTKITERAVLRKFHQEEDGSLTLYEAIVILDGQIIETWKLGDDRLPPED